MKKPIRIGLIGYGFMRRWAPGLCLGYEHSFIHELAEFFKSLDDPAASIAYPDFRNALGTQYVCDAVLESAKTKRWVDVKMA